jgi:hypothetical protein
VHVSHQGEARICPATEGPSNRRLRARCVDHTRRRCALCAGATKVTEAKPRTERVEAMMVDRTPKVGDAHFAYQNLPPLGGVVEGRFVAYYRVSTEHQGANGNGMTAHSARPSRTTSMAAIGSWSPSLPRWSRASASTIGRNLKGHSQRRKSPRRRLFWRSSIVSRAMWHSLPT